MHTTSLSVTIKPRTRQPKKVLVEFDADQFERLAANLGFYSPEFLRSLARAEKDYRAGRMRKITSLRELRKQRVA